MINFPANNVGFECWGRGASLINRFKFTDAHNLIPLERITMLMKSWENPNQSCNEIWLQTSHEAAVDNLPFM